MPRYRVSLDCLYKITGNAVIEVVAPNPERAGRLALGIAGENPGTHFDIDVKDAKRPTDLRYYDVQELDEEEPTDG
jgi:hypothetical protein